MGRRVLCLRKCMFKFCSRRASDRHEHGSRGAGQMEEEKMRACGHITKMASMSTVGNAALS